MQMLMPTAEKNSIFQQKLTNLSNKHSGILLVCTAPELDEGPSCDANQLTNKFLQHQQIRGAYIGHIHRYRLSELFCPTQGKK
jgi:hypothetical protein